MNSGRMVDRWMDGGQMGEQDGWMVGRWVNKMGE